MGSDLAGLPDRCTVQKACYCAGLMGWVVGLLLAAQVEVTMGPRAGCPGAAAVARDIETLIGEPVPRVEVRIDVRDASEGVVADVRYTANGRTQTRSIPGANCADVVNAAAVVVAVGVDPIAVHQTLEPVLQRPSEGVPEVVEPPPALPQTDGPEPVPEPEQPPVETVSASPRTERSVGSPPRRPSLGAFVRGGVGVAGLPDPMGWVGGGLQVGLAGLRIELTAQHLFAQRVEHPQNSSTGANVSMTSARPGACWTPSLGGFTLGGCLGLDLGVARGEGVGLESPGTGRALWVAVTPGFRAHWHPTRRFFVGAVLDLPISVERPTLTIDDFETPLLKTGLVGVWTGLSVGFTFFDESAGRRR